MTATKRGFTSAEAAIYLGISEFVLKQGRMKSVPDEKMKTPRHIKLGKKKVIYLKEDLDAWLDQQLKEAISAGGAS